MLGILFPSIFFSFIVSFFFFFYLIYFILDCAGALLWHVGSSLWLVCSAAPRHVGS